jgi:capsular exopolysaccharide synthesis family protein
VEQVPNLWLITSGPIPPNPSELLGSMRMKELLAKYRQAFTYIILDTPPINPVTDPSILAGYADATILVIEQGRTTYASATHAKRSLERVDARILGVVMNKLRSSGAYYNYESAYYAAEGLNGTPATAPTSAPAESASK